MCSTSWFFAKALEARELIKNCELNLYVSRDGLSHCTKIIYLGDLSEKLKLKRLADLQEPICYNDVQNKGINLMVC